jgi:hypothetical protein
MWVIDPRGPLRKNHEGEKTMKRLKRYLFVFIMGMMALPGMAFFSKIARVQRRKGTGEGEEKSMNEKPRDSKATLEKANAQA